MDHQADAIRRHNEVIARGDHLIDRMRMRDVVCSRDLFVVELDSQPEISNVRGAIQGGMIMTLIDCTAGRLVLEVLDGGPAATADMTVHFLAPVILGPARAESRIVRRGRRSIVTNTEVFDVGGDRLAAISTVTFAVLEPR